MYLSLKDEHKLYFFIETLDEIFEPERDEMGNLKCCVTKNFVIYRWH
jgi:hypothetical protein